MVGWDDNSAVTFPGSIWRNTHAFTITLPLPHTGIEYIIFVTDGIIVERWWLLWMTGYYVAALIIIQLLLLLTFVAGSVIGGEPPGIGWYRCWCSCAGVDVLLFIVRWLVWWFCASWWPIGVAFGCLRYVLRFAVAVAALPHSGIWWLRFIPWTIVTFVAWPVCWTVVTFCLCCHCCGVLMANAFLCPHCCVQPSVVVLHLSCVSVTCLPLLPDHYLCLLLLLLLLLWDGHWIALCIIMCVAVCVYSCVWG